MKEILSVFWADEGLEASDEEDGDELEMSVSGDEEEEMEEEEEEEEKEEKEEKEESEDDVDGDLRGMVKEDPESANRKYNVLIPWDRKA